MTVTLDERLERVLLKQVVGGEFATAEEAVEAAIWQAYGTEATPELEAALEEAVSHPGARVSYTP